MEVLLFRALTEAKIDADTVQKVVDAVEEHIDVAVGQANKALESSLKGMQTSLDGKLDGMKTSMDAFKGSVDQMRVWLTIVTSIVAICALLGTVLGIVSQFIK